MATLITGPNPGGHPPMTMIMEALSSVLHATRADRAPAGLNRRLWAVRAHRCGAVSDPTVSDHPSGPGNSGQVIKPVSRLRDHGVT
jgi:hypothetical protein